MTNVLLRGILRKWSGTSGVIYCNDGSQFFCHKNKIICGQAYEGARVNFIAGPQRSPDDLPKALEIEVLPKPDPSNTEGQQ